MEKNNLKNKIDEFGSIFRFVTPLLIGVLGWTSVSFLSSIDYNFKSINKKFEVFLESYHAMDKRVDRLEYKVFKDGDKK